MRFPLYNKKTVPKYSIVVPLHNEQENVTDLYDRLKVVMETHGETFEGGGGGGYPENPLDFHKMEFSQRE